MIKINNPYRYTNEEKALIAANPASSGDDWKSSTFGQIKENIKEYLLQVQNNICPYCGSKLRLAVMYPHLEHIAHKGLHFRFMFHPNNLVISCVVCNTHKGSKETFVDPSVDEYPNSGDAFCIIHPYFDNYFEHIELIEGCIFSARTSKGERTIDYCNLTRESLLTENKKMQDGNTICEELERNLQNLPEEHQAFFRRSIENLKKCF